MGITIFEARNRMHLVEVIFYVFLIFGAVMWLGLYMIDKWERIRDLQRQTDARYVRNVVDMYLLNYDFLPENETGYDWDYSYNIKTNQVSILFNNLREKKIISPIFDPMNNSKYHYKYHKFKAGEYGCDRAFAIFQVSSFEGKIANHGSGSCPEKDFVKDAPNGYTIQWFE